MSNFQAEIQSIQSCIGSRYHLLELLGKKSGRRTLLALDQETNQQVVIKLLTFGEDFAWDDLKLFEREAETLRSLDHPALPKYLDFFDVETEQYYLHVDPANTVLATTRTDVVTWYHSPNGSVDMPVAWTRAWGLGRVYYNSLGHKADIIAGGPAYEMIKRGVIWAGGSKAAAQGKDPSQFQSPGNHW